MPDKKVSPEGLYRSIALLDPGNAKVLENAAHVFPVASNPIVDVMFGEGSADRAVRFLEDHLAQIAQKRYEQIEALRSKYRLVDDAVMGRKTLTDVVQSSLIDPLKSVPNRYFTRVKDMTDFEESVTREYSSTFKPAGDDLSSIFGDTPFPEAEQAGGRQDFFYWVEKGTGYSLGGLAAFAAGLFLPGGGAELIIGVLEVGFFGSMGFNRLSMAETYRLKPLVSFFGNVKLQASVLDKRVSTTYQTIKCEIVL